jgi:hypothetical protein
MGLVGWLAADAISIAIICTRGYCRGGGNQMLAARVRYFLYSSLKVKFGFV